MRLELRLGAGPRRTGQSAAGPVGRERRGDLVGAEPCSGPRRPWRPAVERVQVRAGRPGEPRGAGWDRRVRVGGHSGAVHRAVGAHCADVPGPAGGRGHHLGVRPGDRGGAEVWRRAQGDCGFSTLRVLDDDVDEGGTTDYADQPGAEFVDLLPIDRHLMPSGEPRPRDLRRSLAARVGDRQRSREAEVAADLVAQVAGLPGDVEVLEHGPLPGDEISHTPHVTIRPIRRLKTSSDQVSWPVKCRTGQSEV